MATKYIYSDGTGPKLNGTQLFFRTLTRYQVDNNGKVVGSPVTGVYYTTKGGGRSSTGEIWTPGNINDPSGFNQGGYVFAAVTTDKGKTFRPTYYTQNDADKGLIPSGKNVGDPVLSATAMQSLNDPNGVLNQAIQNSIINTAVKTQPGLAPQLAAKLSNTQPTPPGGSNGTVPNNTGGITKEEIDAAGADVVNINIPSKNPQTSGYMGIHVYPSDMRKTNQDRIKFTLYESLGADISANPTQIFQPNFSGRVISQRRSTVSLGEVYLPIQPSITDSNNVEWSGASLNAFEAAAFSKSVGLMGQPNVASAAGDIYNSVKEAMKGLASQDNSIAQSLKVFLAQEAVGIQGMLSRTTGSVLNPNLELLFNGPSLRPFNFTFRLSPRDEPEATEVRKIIRFFKKGMSVRNASSNVFLKAPNVFDIQYQVGEDNSPHKSLPRIKRCALLSCDVDYTPDGTYMTFNDDAKTLTSYQISLRFSELEPIYDTDYEKTEGQIGY